jgi:hypothetical protein
LRQLLALCAAAFFCLAGVWPASADWTRVQVNGISVCRDGATGATFKPPYSAKADVTKACNVLTVFVPWLGTAEAASVIYSLPASADGTRDTTYPNGDKPPLPAWDDPCLVPKLAVIANQLTTTTTSINVETCLTGTSASSATLSFVQSDGTTSCAAQWSVTGTTPTRALADSSPAAASGSCKLRALYMGNSAYSALYPWSYTAPVVSTAMKWHVGPYFDCSVENRAGNAQIVLNNAVYNILKSCMDFAATQTGVKGVFVLANWATFEGDTAGCYDSSCSNALGSAGTIGYPLWDALLTYAASKSLKVIIGIQWSVSYYGACGSGGDAWAPAGLFPAYLVQSSCSGGTDASNTYGVTLLSNGYIFVRLWKAAVMDKLIALAQAYGTRYDGNAALEKVVFFEQDPSFSGAVGTDGFDWTALATQMARLPAAIRPYWTHTNLGMETNWMTPSGELTVNAAMGSSSAYFMVEANNSIPWQSSYGENTYLGLGVVSGQNFGTHDYRTEIPFGVWTAGPEQCDLWDSKPNADAANNYTPTEFYNYYMTLGKTDSSGHPLKPSHWIVGRVTAAQECPGVASQQWGTLTSGGWYQMFQTHTLNTTCPSLYAGGCNTN